MKRHLLRALLLAVALATLGGVGYAASDASSSRPQPLANDVPAQHAKPVPGLTQAYGTLVPFCEHCDPLRKGATPLRREQSMNVVLAPVRGGAPEGTWCFALEGGLDQADVTVTVSVLHPGVPYAQHFVLEHAQWISGAPNCGHEPNIIEIQASGSSSKQASWSPCPTAMQRSPSRWRRPVSEGDEK